MKKFNFYAISKYLICLLCCLVLFSLISRPLIVSANTALVAYGVQGVAVGSVSWPLAVCLLAVVAVCGLAAYGDDIVDAFSDAYDWYTTNTVISAWADEASVGIDYGAVIVIPEEVQLAMQKKAHNKNQKAPDTMPLLFVPNSLLSCDTLTQTDLLGADVVGTLQEGNELQKKSNTLLSQLSQTLTSVCSNIAEVSSDIYGRAVKTYNMVEGKLVSIRGYIAGLHRLVEGKLVAVRGDMADLYRLLDAKMVKVSGLLADIPNALEGKLVDIRSNLKDISDSLDSSVKKWVGNVETSVSLGFDNLTTTIENAVASITQAINGNNGNGGDDGDDNNEKYPIFGGFVSEGNHLFGTFADSAGGVLDDYSSGFLVAGLIFNEFANISLFNHLLSISLCLGAVAALLGIALSVSSFGDKAYSRSGKTKSSNASSNRIGYTSPGYIQGSSTKLIGR